jgi:steroid delta-isomerase-like uncharacterized protein
VATNVERMWKDYFTAWNSHDVEKITSFFTNEGVYEGVGLGLAHRGKREIKEFIKRTFVWSPDVKFDMKSFFSAGGWIGSEWVMTGTHAGELGRIPATGKRFSVRGASIAEVREGKISRNCDYWNVVAFLQQVGLMPEAPSQ